MKTFPELFKKENTGLKDIHGECIHEGDLIRWWEFILKDKPFAEHLGRVKYYRGSFIIEEEYVYPHYGKELSSLEFLPHGWFSYGADEKFNGDETILEIVKTTR